MKRKKKRKQKKKEEGNHCDQWLLFDVLESGFISPCKHLSRLESNGWTEKSHHIEIRYGFKPMRAQSTTAVTQLKDTGNETVRNTRAQPSTKTAPNDTQTNKRKAPHSLHIRLNTEQILLFLRWFLLSVICVCRCRRFSFYGISCPICILFSLFTRDETIREYNKHI